MDRRHFLGMLGAASGSVAGFASAVPGFTATSSRVATHSSVRTSMPAIYKAVKYDMVRVEGSVQDKFMLLAELGFDGVEMGSPNDLVQEEVVAASRTVGLPIHGVVDMVHWNKTLSDPDPAVREEGLEGLRIALQDAAAYGASTVLLVPAVVQENVSYDDAWQRSQAEIRKVLPEASSLGVRIAIENVWNNFLMSPLEFARYIDEFESDWVGAYFDIGNVITFGWPEHWIRILGERILKLDVKEFSRRKRNEEGMYAGFNVPLGEGDVNWPAVREHLTAIGFTGWATAEIPGGDRERLEEIAWRMDRVLYPS